MPEPLVWVVGGFISHHMDKVLFWVRSAIAVKILGPDLAELRRLDTASRYRLAMGALADTIETGLTGSRPPAQPIDRHP